MEVYTLEKDMKIICVTAKSFPYDIKKAFHSLIGMLPSIEGRTFMGISYQTKSGEILYKAAVLELFRGESKRYNCEPYTIRKGEYISETLKNWRKDESSIGITFKKLADSRADTTFPCVEWYKGQDVMCMIRIDSAIPKLKNSR